MPIIVVTGKEIEKIKGDFESYLNGLNMVGEISYSQYSELYDEGTKQIQKAYELGKSEFEKENAELKERLELLNLNANIAVSDLNDLLTKAKEIIKKYYKYRPSCEYFYEDIDKEAEQFLNEVEK